MAYPTPETAPATVQTAESVSFDELLERAKRLAAEPGRRVLGITGTPGAGKSTLCASLLDALGDRAALIGMDGFHLANDELVRLQRRDRKGAPDTFDVGGYAALLGRVREQDEAVLYAPRFDRTIEESIGSAVPIPLDTPLIITEGNYLLMTAHGWAPVRDLLDEAWYLDVAPEVRHDRLVRRRERFGHAAEESEAWVRDVDEANAVLIDATRERADLLCHLTTMLGASDEPHAIRQPTEEQRP